MGFLNFIKQVLKPEKKQVTETVILDKIYVVTCPCGAKFKINSLTVESFEQSHLKAVETKECRGVHMNVPRHRFMKYRKSGRVV